MFAKLTIAACFPSVFALSGDFSGSSRFSGFSGDEYSIMISGGFSETFSGFSGDYSDMMSEEFSAHYSNRASSDYSEDVFSGFSGGYSEKEFSSETFSGFSGDYSDMMSEEFSTGISAVPTVLPTVAPTILPTEAPTASPSSAPTAAPSSSPSFSPTAAPTAIPTLAPTFIPTVEGETNSPTVTPTAAPTATPTTVPTFAPTAAPTYAPSSSPTTSPTVPPTATPTFAPTIAPTFAPTPAPTYAPSSSPTTAPTVPPTATPTFAPTIAPTFSPTALGETVAPTTAPTRTPTLTPTKNPTRQPTLTPTRAPTGFPTSVPTSIYDTLEASERTKSCYSDCSYPGMTVQPADWDQEEYCAFYASTTCTEQSVSQDVCTPTCLTDCVDVFCDTMSTLVYACDSDSTETYADKTALENQCLDANAANAETETLLVFSTASSFDDVSAAEMEASEDAKTAARTTMSLAMSGVPVNQIVITDISDSSTRRHLQGGASRKLTTSTEVTYQITAKLEALGFKSTDGDAAYSSLTGQISNSVSSGAFQQNLKASGQSIGVTTFSNAEVKKAPAYTEPQTVPLVTTTPTSMPSRAPSVFSKRGGGDDDDGGISDGIIAVIVIFSIVGCICIVVCAFYTANKNKREELEEQFKQHNFMSRMSSRSGGDSINKRSASGGPSVKSFDSIDEQYGVRGKKKEDEHVGMDIEMESKRQSDLLSRRASEEHEEVRPTRTTSRKSDI